MLTDDELHQRALLLATATPDSDQATLAMAATSELFRRQKVYHDVWDMVAELLDPESCHPCELRFRNGKLVLQWRDLSAKRRKQ